MDRPFGFPNMEAEVSAVILSVCTRFGFAAIAGIVD
jgi:hypothetical protein